MRRITRWRRRTTVRFTAGSVTRQARQLAAVFDCRDDLALHVAGHEDDDILFMNPDLDHDVTAGRCVLTVFATAGDAGRGEAHWRAREMGARAAYAEMAGVADQWTRSTVTLAGQSLTLDTLDGQPSIGLLFMRLPDGSPGGGGYAVNGGQSLLKLWQATITTVQAVDGSASYSRTSLIATFTAIMTTYRPTLIRTQDYVGRFGDGDHSDHHASAYFALAGSRNYVTPHTITAYRGYPVSTLPANLTTAERDRKLEIFMAYAAQDTTVCQSSADCLSTSFGPWYSRQYTSGAELGGRQNVAPLGTVTGSSQNTSANQQAVKAVDGVVAGYPDGTTNEWATVAGKAGSWLNIAWGSPHTLDKVVLYDRPNANDRVTAGTLTFSDGTTLATGALPNDGSAHVITFTPRRVTSLRFTVTEVSASTVNIGLAELQAFSTNVAPRATVTASSQNTSTGQQAVKAVDGYAVGYPVDATREWVTVGGKAGSWIRLAWDTPQTVTRVVLYDRPNVNDRITGGTLTFSDGSTVPVPTLPNDGTGLTITFTARTITSVQLMVTSVSATTSNVGLAEIQVESA